MKVIVCIAKNEPNILDWIKYHIALGFDHIHVYANDWSFPEIPSIFHACVSVYNWPGKAQQLNAYNNALRNIGYFDYCAFIDVDEYIVCPEGLDNFLKDKNHTIAMPWIMMGNKESEGKTVFDRFKHWDYDPNGHVKMLIKGNAHPVTFVNPHFVSGTPMFSPNGANHSGPFTKEKPDRIYIKHFYWQDKAWFNAKMERGRVDTGQKRQGEKWEDGDKFNTYDKEI